MRKINFTNFEITFDGTIARINATHDSSITSLTNDEILKLLRVF